MPVTHWSRPTGVNTNTTGNQQDTSVAALDVGGYVVVWTDTSTANSSIRGQIYGADGSKVGGEFTASNDAAKVYTHPDVAALSGGGFVVTFTYQLSGIDYDIYGRIYNASGTPAGASPIQLYSPSAIQDYAEVTRLGTGFAIVFSDALVGNNVRQVTFNAAGTQQSASAANTVAVVGGFADYATIAELSNGNFVSVWRETGGGVGYRIFNSSGVAQTGVLSAGASTAFELAVTPFGNGGFTIAWSETVAVPAPDAGGGSILMRTFNAAGAAITGPLLANIPNLTQDDWPELTALPDGRLFATWPDFANNIYYGRTIDPMTGVGGPPVVINASGPSAAATTSFNSNLSITTLTDGRIAAVWTGSDGTGNGVITQILDPRDGSVIGTNAGNDTLYGNERANDDMSGLGGNDTMFGLAGNDWMNGGAGNDTLNGGDGNDLVIGGDGNDTMNGDAGDDLMYGEAGQDTLNGGAGNDTLVGQLGNDTLNGGAGNDFLWIEGGNDTVTGGTGSDIFYLTSYTDGVDYLMDFNRAEGDVLWFSAAGFGLPSLWSFTEGFNFFSGVAPTATSATATFLYNTSFGVLYYDIDGTGAQPLQAVAYSFSGPIVASDLLIV